jgi:hypothetical protein
MSQTTIIDTIQPSGSRATLDGTTIEQRRTIALCPHGLCEAPVHAGPYRLPALRVESQTATPTRESAIP